MATIGRHELWGVVALGFALGMAVGRLIASQPAATLDGLTLVTFALGCAGVVLLRDLVSDPCDTDSGRVGQMKQTTVVHELTRDEAHAYAVAQKTMPAPGARVGLWRVGGAWRVWSAGPKAGSVWLVPDDEAAHEITDIVVREHRAGWPVIFQVHHGASGTVAFAVSCRELRPRVAVG